tara:strand:- start:1473 stop:2432 length:960 start_codon:yes stop_codon:yes gene_type:complete
MKILVTGCAGFIGYHFCKNNFTKKKIQIVGVDNLNSYYSVSYKKKRLQELKKNKKFKFYKVDLSDFKKLKKIFIKHKFDIVMNLAAQAGVRYSIEKPSEYFKSNFLGFFNIIELSRSQNVKKIFYASSSSVYGEKKNFPLKESQQISPTNTYSLSKKNNEEIAEIYSKYYNMNFIGLRFFTIYGEWGRPDMLILKYIIAIKRKKFFYLNNFGNHYRDFTYIEDAIKNLNVLVSKNHKKKNDIYNICSGKPINIQRVLQRLNQVFGKPKIIKRNKQKADVFKTHGSNQKLKNFTKLRKYTSIEEGLNNLISWFKLNKNLF